MTFEVDYQFLSQLEGGCHTGGYVPAVERSKSGVTIATGFDLGARNEADLRMLGLTPPLIEKLKPYLGLRNYEALRSLEKKPLNITIKECLYIDQMVKTHYLVQLSQRYNHVIPLGKTRFEDLPSEFQTVITSVSFQYGLDLSRVTPRFWSAVVAQDWPLAVTILREFKDQYPTRRNKEADLMERAL